MLVKTYWTMPVVVIKLNLLTIKLNDVLLDYMHV